MKNKILLIILLLIPFIVKAEDPTDLFKVWESTDSNAYKDTYYTNNKYIKYSNTRIKSIDRYTGKEKVIEIAGGYQLFKEDNTLLIIRTEEDNYTYARLYDEKLNNIKETKLGKFNVDYCIYETNEIKISGEYTDNKGVHRIIFIIDLDGNIKKQSEIITVYNTYIYKNKNNEIIFTDESYNNYYIEDNIIKRENINSDNTFVVAKDNKVYKYSSSGELLKTTQLPEGEGAAIAKKDNFYYVVTGTYIEKPKTYEGQNDEVYITLNFYKLNENIDIVATNIREYWPEDYADASGAEDYRNMFYIMNYSNKIYIFLYSSTSYSRGRYFLLDEDLEYDNASDSAYYIKTEKTYILNEKQTELKDYFTEYPEIANKLADSGYIEKIVSQNITSFRGEFKVIEDGDKYIVNVLGQRKEGGQFDGVMYTKQNLVYYDKNLNEIFSKEIYDWTRAGRPCGQPTNANSILYNDYIVLAADSNIKNYVQIYDKQGNLVKDLSDDFKDETMSNLNLFTFKKGIVVEYGFADFECGTRGSSYDGEVLDELEEPKIYKHQMIYYEYPFDINTTIKGEGTITVDTNKAVEGAEVTFTVTPKEGYVLGEIKVTDANGNVITFHDYTFTMPSSDVLVEVTFIKNPNTKSFFSISIISLAIISLFAMYVLVKNRRENN